MKIETLLQSHWKQKKKTAELVPNDKTILTMEFNHKKTTVYVDDRRLVIHKAGFWLPQVFISEDNKIILTQKHLGFWGSKNEIK